MRKRLEISALEEGNNFRSEGLVRDLNPRPLAPEARIIPLDQRAMFDFLIFKYIIQWNEIVLLL